MLKFRKLKSACAAGLALSLFSGVAVAKDQITIHWLQWWDPEYGVEVMDDLVARFETKTQIKVERTGVPWDNMFELLVANARASVADYDVLGMEAEWITAIDRLGGIEPLDPLLSAAPDFAGSLTEATPVRWMGVTGMLNWYIFPYSYTYNVKAFEKAGIEPPKSWDEVIPKSRRIAEASGSMKGFGTFYNESGSDYLPYYMFGSRLAQLGGKFFDGNGNVAFNSPEGVAALQWWKKVYDSGILPPGAFGASKGSVREQFATEKIAAMWDGPFAGTIARQTNPDIAVAYAPAWCDTTCGYQWGGSGLSIAANSEKKEAAWKFIRFLLSEEISVHMTKTVGLPFATKAAVALLETSDNPILREIPPMMTADAKHNLVIAPIPDTERLHREFNNQFVSFVRGEKSAKEALDQAAAVWKEAHEAVR
ncbi:MAG: sugar ABC transporter substrate-binding protein [Rhodospirillales bacterium]|nr:sugar ABC transporter substrate-binding protein [Rhodospirillales bacterium]